MIRFSLHDFLACEAGGGPVTVDWIVLLGGLTLSGLTMVDVVGGAMEDHAHDVRGALQTVYFDAASLNGALGGQTSEPSGSGSGPTGDGGHWTYPDARDDSAGDGAASDDGAATAAPGTGRGGPNGNNGHGNDADGNDESNPGASNARDDRTDEDGAPGGHGKHAERERADRPDGAPSSRAPEKGDRPSAAPDAGEAEPVVPAANVQGCPSNAYIAEPIAVTGDALAENGIEIEDMRIGGARTNINRCAGIPGNRFFYANPTVTLDLSGLGRYDELSVGLGSDACKLALLVQDASGAFRFRNGGGRDSVEIELSRMADLEGRVNIWVGTAKNQTCRDGELEIEIDD
ncbi:MAG: hypothetical protein ACOCYW_06750 [Roseicyclus sp.]